MRAALAIAKKEFRGVSGLSMGGWGALVYGLRHPDVFAGCAAFSAAIRTDAPADDRDPMDRDVLRSLGAPDIPALQAPLDRLADRRGA